MKSYREWIQQLNEGVYDKGIFKAFFIAGAPGAGKTFVTNEVTTGMNLKYINSDDVFERNLQRANLGFDVHGMSDEEYEKAMEIREKSKKLANLKQQAALQGRLGLVIDGTGKDFDKIRKQADSLRSLGYDTYMIFVNVPLEVSLQRNQMRPRKVPEDIVRKSWEQVQSNMGKFQNYFSPEHFIVVDNTSADENVLGKVRRRIMGHINDPVENYIAKQWISSELEAKRRA